MAQAQNDFNETVSTIARDMYTQLPEEEKKSSFGQALSYITSLGLTGKDLWTKYKLSNGAHRRNELLDGMQRIINLGKDKQRFYDAFQYHQDNVTDIGKIDYEIYFGCNAQRMNDKIKQCEDTLSLTKNFNDAIHAAQQKMADEVIQTSAITSSVIIILQVVKLHFVWKDISVATNLYNNSKKFQQIEENIRMLRTIVRQLTQSMQSNNMTQVPKISKRAHNIYNQTKSLINNLQVKINKSLERLDVSANGQVFDGLSNLFIGIGNSVQLKSVLHYASTSDTVLAIGIITTFIVLNVTHLVTYRTAKKRRDQLQQDIDHLDNFNQQLDQFYEIIEEPENFIQEQFN